MGVINYLKRLFGKKDTVTELKPFIINHTILSDNFTHTLIVTINENTYHAILYGKIKNITILRFVTGERTYIDVLFYKDNEYRTMTIDLELSRTPEIIL